ncbi:Homeobox domain containing protein [Aphelenchoides besseyi]|nr:Homeobox domain containing protein [Aphelenchoides besseyi]
MAAGSPLGLNAVLPTLKKRRKRTNLDTIQKDKLDQYFDDNCRPDHQRMLEIAAELDLDPDVVRVWFCNRRQKLRKVN